MVKENQVWGCIWGHCLAEKWPPPEELPDLSYFGESAGP